MDAENLEEAVQAYATESEGFTRSKVFFSDNWFTSGRWLKCLHHVEEAREAGKAKEAELLKGLADWVTDRHPLCRHITRGQVTALLAANLLKELHALEKRSTGRIESKVNGFAHCVALLMKSHLTSVTTLADLLAKNRITRRFGQDWRPAEN